MIGRHPILVSSAALGHPPFGDLVDVVRAAGFDGFTMWPHRDWDTERRRGTSPEAMWDVLEENGLVVPEVEAIVAWAGINDPGPPYFEEPPRPLLYEAAAAVGATSALAVIVGDAATPTPAVAEVLGELCDEAAGHGLRVHIEFGLGTLVRTFDQAASLVESTGRSNVGIIVDTWALHWSPGGAPARLVADPSLIGGVQVNGAPAERPADFAHATRRGRLPVGDGIDDYGPVLTLLGRVPDLPVTVEVLNDERLRALGPLAWAHLLADGARQLLG